jgi:ParB family transcriptional regulator, chromosome partitioning protein
MQTLDKPETQVELDFVHLDINCISPSRWQPRTDFDEKELNKLAQSIREYGVLQPITVRPAQTDGRFELVFGERRLRAAIRANLKEIPARIRLLDDQAAMKIALIENIQRQNLNDVEETQAILDGLSQLLELSPEETTKVLYSLRKANGEFSHNVMGKSKYPYQKYLTDIEGYFEELGVSVSWQSYTANKLPLLGLPDQLQVSVKQKLITASAAMALNAVQDPVVRSSLLEEAINSDLSVRDIRNKGRQSKLGNEKGDKSELTEAGRKGGNDSTTSQNDTTSSPESVERPPSENPVQSSKSHFLEIKRAKHEVRLGDRWQLTPYTLLFCGSPDDPKFREEILPKENIDLALAFPKSNLELSSLIPRNSLETLVYIGRQEHWDAEITEDIIKNALDNSTEEGNNVCFSYFPNCTSNIWATFLEFDVKIYISEPDLQKCLEIIQSWNNYGLAKKDDGTEVRRFPKAKLIAV